MSARTKSPQLNALDLAVRKATGQLLKAMREAQVDELVVTMQASTGRVTFTRHYKPRETDGEPFFVDPVFENVGRKRRARGGR